ncbi:hypothetical protein DICPUDRAFT_160201, partial [Dictyostelium purpureum]
MKLMDEKLYVDSSDNVGYNGNREGQEYNNSKATKYDLVYEEQSYSTDLDDDENEAQQLFNEKGECKA